ncbi:winged helix-turn-helix transcriptional regulator, partial [Psychromarinibacter sp. C21-152]
MALRGTNQELGRPLNRRIVLETIRQKGPVTRVQIARQVGLTVQTVSTIAAELEKLGIIGIHPGMPKGRGFPAPRLEVNPNGGFACGVYVTPLGLEAGLMNLSGEVLDTYSEAATQISADAAFDRISAVVAKLVADIPPEKVFGVGMAMPGPFDIESMSCVGPTTMEQWRGVDV